MIDEGAILCIVSGYSQQCVEIKAPGKVRPYPFDINNGEEIDFLIIKSHGAGRDMHILLQQEVFSV